MNIHDHTDFFGDHSFSSYYATLDTDQQDQLGDFYQAHCLTPNDAIVNNHPRPLITFGKTPHHLFVAVQRAIGAHKNFDDFAVFTCRQIDGSLQTEQYEILEIDYSKSETSQHPEQIIRAKGELTSNLAVIELGSKATWLEFTRITAGAGEQELLLPFLIDHFRMPTR